MLFSVRQLVYCNDSILMGEHHDVVNKGYYGRHGIHVTLPKDYILIQVSVQDFDVYVDLFFG